MENYKILDITPKWGISERKSEAPITGPESIAILARDYYKAKNLDPMKEHCICIVLNRGHKIIGFNHVSMGSVSASIVHPREVYKPAISLGASAIILVHNHPSGELKPSRQDIEITRKIIDAGEILDIPILDHIILNLEDNKDNFYYSLTDVIEF